MQNTDMKTLIYSANKNKTTLHDTAVAELLSAAKDVVRVAAYKTLAVQALAAAVRRVEEAQ